jgi:hypothetical protein
MNNNSIRSHSASNDGLPALLAKKTEKNPET